jgi:hypothetical protein
MTVKTKVLLGAVLAVALLAPQAKAGADVQFGASVNVNDNTSLFFGVSSRYFGREPRVVEDWGRRVPDPDDLSVLLFLSSRSGRSPDAVFALRRGGLSWWDVSLRLGVRPDVWFVPVQRHPGPPYGNAYGHWKKHGRNGNAYRIDDRAARDLVAVRVIHEYYGIPADRAMDMRRRGQRIDRLVCDEYRTRHGKGRAKAQEVSMRDGRGRHEASSAKSRDDRDERREGKKGGGRKGGHKGGKGPK